MFSFEWNIKFRKVVVNVLEENLNWLENTYFKIGNEIRLEGLGYLRLDNDKALLFINVTNRGLSDQIVSSIPIDLGNGTKVLSEGAEFNITGLKRRHSQIETVPIQLSDELMIQNLNVGLSLDL